MSEIILTTGSGYLLEIEVRRLDGTTWNLATATVDAYLRRVPTTADPIGELIANLLVAVVDAESGLITVTVPPTDLTAGGLWTLTVEVIVNGVPQRSIPVAFLVRTAP